MSSEQPTPATMTFQWVFSYRNPGNIKYQRLDLAVDLGKGKEGKPSIQMYTKIS